MTRDQLVFEEMFRDSLYGPRDGLTPRDWQEECLSRYWESMRAWSGPGPHVFCIYAGTGAGKTKAGGLIAAMMLNGGMAEQVVLVCPNRSILRKTQRDFLRFFGIDLARFRKGTHRNGVPRMQQGYILTYQAIMNDPTLHRRLCQNTRTLVILDEIHHLGDESKWGEPQLTIPLDPRKAARRIAKHLTREQFSQLVDEALGIYTDKRRS